MNKKSSHQPVKKEPQTPAKPRGLVRDSRGFIVELPKPNATQLVQKGIWPFKDR